MLETLSIRPRICQQIRSGTLGQWIDDFVDVLATRGYGVTVIRYHVRAAAIFVTARPPYRQIIGANVTAVAKQALRRAGDTVPRPGAHVFRHTFASQMVRRDVPMETVADLLGHARLHTTTIYAKLDRETWRRSPCRGPEVHDDRRGLATALEDLRRVAPAIGFAMRPESSLMTFLASL